MYTIIILEEAQADIARLAKSEPNAARKALSLIDELKTHPRTGTGHPEQLRHYSDERWSRRITGKHRLVYRIKDTEIVVEVISAYGHYSDK